MGKFQIYEASYSSGMSNKVKQASAKLYMFQKFNIVRVKRIMVNEKTVKDGCHFYLDSWWGDIPNENDKKRRSSVKTSNVNNNKNNNNRHFGCITLQQCT